MKDQTTAFRKYCELSRENSSQPVRFDDAFGLNEQPEGLIHADAGEVHCHYAARAKFKNVKVVGNGSLTIIAGFSAIIENINIHIPSGELFILIGPYSEIKNMTVLSFSKNNSLHFGAGSTINTGSMHIEGEGAGIFFGHDCMFSTQVHARTSDSHSIFSYETRQRINTDRSIKIGDHVWIGRHVTINKGACVDDDVIIGQESLVSGNATRSSCYAGIPAKCIKTHVTWERERMENLDDINGSYHYRPRQLAVNRFLTEDAAFHPRASDQHDSIRDEHKVCKDYPWIPPVLFEGRF